MTDDNKIFEICESKIPYGSLEGKYKKTWIEDSMIIGEQEDSPAKIDSRRGYLGSAISTKKFIIASIIIGVIFFIIIGRILYLQVWRGDYYREMADGNRVRILPILAERGVIFDRQRRELLQNVPDFSLTMVPQDLPRDPIERQAVINKAAEISSVPMENISQILDKYRSYSYASLVIKENLDYETALKLYIDSSELPGITIKKGSKRDYFRNIATATTSSLSLSHVLGYLGKLDEDELSELRQEGYLPFDSIGKIGLEKTYEKILRGTYGRKKVEVDAWGRERSVISEEPPTAGKNLILTLDLEAQYALEKELNEMLQKRGLKRAAAVVMDPRSGGILALVSLPSFDNNSFAGSIKSEIYRSYIQNQDQPLFNRAIGGTYPSGSTVKLVVAAAALQENIANLNTTFLSTGGLRVGRWFFKDWLSGGHGITNVTKAIAWSINTFFYYVGGGYGDFEGLGVDRLSSYMRSFNLGARTGVDIPGEAAGFVPTTEWKLRVKGERWFVGDTYNMAIGQGDLLVTPMQVALWTSIVANGGTITQPHLADKVEDTASDSLTDLKFANQKVPVDAKHLATVRRGMRECVTLGSCKLLQSLPFASGGKTGTAQWSSSKKPHAWFTAFAPLKNPRVVIAVLVEEGDQGSTVAMPVARNFLSWWGKKYWPN